MSGLRRHAAPAAWLATAALARGVAAAAAWLATAAPAYGVAAAAPATISRAVPAHADTTPVACSAADAPDAVVCRFYRRYIELHPPGLPTPREQRELAPFLSIRLQRALDFARSHQTGFIRRHPGEKPPFVDGCLFASLFEGPRRFTITRVTSAPDGGARVTVRFELDASTHWEDVVWVSRERERYVIADVFLSGAGAFNPAGKLSERLWRPED